MWIPQWQAMTMPLKKWRKAIVVAPRVFLYRYADELLHLADCCTASKRTRSKARRRWEAALDELHARIFREGWRC